MSWKVSILFMVILAIGLVGCSGPANETEETASPAEEAAHEAEPLPDEQVAELKAMCTQAAEAMVARQAEVTLYDRIGGRDGIHDMVADAVARHQVNDQISHFMEGVEVENLISQVTDFLVVGTGGAGEYTGRTLVDAHAHMKLSNADFLATGDDMEAAMDVAGWGKDEKQELLCAFIGLHGEVVTQ